MLSGGVFAPPWWEGILKVFLSNRYKAGLASNQACVQGSADFGFGHIRANEDEFLSPIAPGGRPMSVEQIPELLAARPEPAGN